MLDRYVGRQGNHCEDEMRWVDSVDREFRGLVDRDEEEIGESESME